MNDDYRMGFRDGYREGQRDLGRENVERRKAEILELNIAARKQTKRKVKQSPKQKLLTQMTKKKWDKYKKGRGKKTYVEIRGEVSRSQAFKKKAKRL